MYTFNAFDNLIFKCDLGYESCPYYIYDDAYLSLSYHIDTTGETHLIAEATVLWNRTAIDAFKAAIALFFSEECDDYYVCPFKFAIEYADKHEFFDEREYRKQYGNAAYKARHKEEED